jgi:hypothetical protein
MMALGNLDGLVVMRSPAGTSEVHFQAGKLVFARGPGQKRTLGEELVRRGLLDRAACESAARERDRNPQGPRIGAILVQRGVIGRETLEALMRERIKEAICAVVDWREGRFTFEAGVHPDEEDILLDVQLESLLLECMTRIDHARRDETHAGEGQA